MLHLQRKRIQKDVNLPMKFDYDIMKNPNNLILSQMSFRQYIGDILVRMY